MCAHGVMQPSCEALKEGSIAARERWISQLDLGDSKDAEENRIRGGGRARGNGEVCGNNASQLRQQAPARRVAPR